MQKSYDCITIGVSGGSIQLLFVVFPTNRLSAHKSDSLLFGRMPSSPLQGTDLLGLSPGSQPSPFQQNRQLLFHTYPWVPDNVMGHDRNGIDWWGSYVHCIDLWDTRCIVGSIPEEIH
jgi:hypothetical protein